MRYYLKVAQNIAIGAGSTFDGLHPTNGYHPLWMLLLAGVARFDAATFMRLILLLGSLLNLGAALILFAVLRQSVRSPWLATFGAGLYFLWSPVVIASLNGLETSLATMLFAAAFYLSVIANGQLLRHAVFLGGLLALLFLARTDTVFYGAAFGVILLVRSEPDQRLRRMLVMGVTALLIVAPWLAWNWVNFGALIQASGIAVPYVLGTWYALAGYSGAEALGQSGQYFAGYLRTEGLIFLGLALGTLVAAVLLRRMPDAADPARTLRRVLWSTLLCGCAALDALYRRDLSGLMRASDVRYLADYDSLMLTMYRPFWGEEADRLQLKPIAAFDDGTGGFHDSHVRVYEVPSSP